MRAGELIRQQRKLKGLKQKQLANMLGASSPSIRLYELGKRTPSEGILRRIADALDIGAETLHGYNVDSSREVLEMPFRMEYEHGMVPMKCDGNHTLAVDGKAPHAPELCRALDAGEVTREEHDAWKASFGR